MALELRSAGGEQEVEQARTLMREYGRHLASHPAGPEHFCLTGFEEELAGLPGAYAAPGALLLAFDDGEAAGCVALRPLPEQDGEQRMELKRLWVRPAFRGRGLGRRLMEAGIAHAHSMGANALLLDTVPAAMPEANRLYGELGFQPTKRYNQLDVEGVAFFRLELAARRAGGGGQNL
ncbi:MAG TPA: GNAT family N-acetyltransferase [Acidobacteriaceae bacterium]|nr:GNAT family N-acetyltransferase [Acidobacteriaceae bacterium]